MQCLQLFTSSSDRPSLIMLPKKVLAVELPRPPGRRTRAKRSSIEDKKPKHWIILTRASHDQLSMLSGQVYRECGSPLTSTQHVADHKRRPHRVLFGIHYCGGRQPRPTAAAAAVRLIHTKTNSNKHTDTWTEYNAI